MNENLNLTEDSDKYEHDPVVSKSNEKENYIKCIALSIVFLCLFTS